VIRNGPYAARLLLGASCALLGLAAASAYAQAPQHGAGESIYLRGILPSGDPLEGERQTGELTARGADAACVNCHQRSGLGSIEGAIFIPPITTEYLFHASGHGPDDPVLPYVASQRNREPYTGSTLARAIREGLDPTGRPLSFLMPRYVLSDTDMAALTGYLKTLSVHRSPGVTDTVLHLATIVTPDADPAKRSGVLDVLTHYVADKNTFPFGPSPRMRTSGKTAYSKSMYMANLRWQLHVWELTGRAETWSEQLERHLRDEPVFAVLSGVGGSNWTPVHEFCERNALPCLFPNVEVPVEGEGDFYSLYFSRAVLLEAAMIATHIARPEKDQPGIIVEQIYRTGDSGEAAARALAAKLTGHGVTVHDRPIAPSATARAVSAAAHEAAKARVLVLWLRPKDLAALGSPPPEQTAVYLSGIMGGLENAPLPASWRARSILAYPFDLPDRRGVRLDYPLGWFSFRHIPVVALQAQADTFLACSLLSETTHDLADAYVRPYLIEELQRMLERRIMTGYYPHLALTYHERFASKGGYLAHFADATGTRLVADGDWTVP
jgi:hypothetical protein